jgi:hypothetical protein
MPPKPKRIFLTLSGILLIGWLICAFFDWYSQPHSRAWHDGREGFEFLALGLSLFVSYKFPRNIAAPDPTTHLFHKSTEESPEGRNQ